MTIIDEIEGTTLSLYNNKKIDLLEIFKIDEDNLSSAFMQQASLYAYFASLQAESELQLSKAQFALEQQQAMADEYYRAWMDKREKKYTEAVIKSLVVRDEEYAAAKDTVIQLEYEVNLLKALVKSLAQRADMLISFGAMTRQEMAMTGMNIRDKELDDLPKDLKAIIRAAKKHNKQV